MINICSIRRDDRRIHRHCILHWRGTSPFSLITSLIYFYDTVFCPALIAEKVYKKADMFYWGIETYSQNVGVNYARIFYFELRFGLNLKIRYFKGRFDPQNS